MNNSDSWKLMNLIIPPNYLAAIINRVQDGTITNAGAKVLFNEVFTQNLAKYLAITEEEKQT